MQRPGGQVSEAEIINTLSLLQSSIASDINGLSISFNKFLQVESNNIISFMNYQLFRGDHNIINYLSQSIANGPKSDEDVRKLIYGFIGDYVVTYKDYISEYLPNLFEKIYSFFKKETSFRPKAQSLSPIKQILINFNSNELNGVFDPVALHKSLTTTIKIEPKITVSVKGEMWVIIGVIQSKFASLIGYNEKKDVQHACLVQLKQLVKKNENFSTIACIIKSLQFSLTQNYLDDSALEQLFNYTKAIMIPLVQTYGASIAALDLICAQSQLFHNLIMKNATQIFKNLTGLMGQQNKQYKFAVLDTLTVVVQQIVIGITANLEDPKMIQLFNFIGNSMWGMLETQIKYDPGKQEEKNRFFGSIMSIVKIMGTLSPLILKINGKQDLQRFFSKLLFICNRKLIRSFEQNEQTTEATKKIHVMKIILYRQKQIVSFIDSFAQIIQQLDQIQQREALNLESLFLIGVRQYHFYFQKYIPKLIQALVKFLMGLYSKPNLVMKWCKKIILTSLMQSLDTKRFNVSSDTDYYIMAKKSSRFWKSLITHPLWNAQVRKNFCSIVFDTLQYLFLNLDISYKTNMELDLESEEHKMREQEAELVNVFFTSDESLQMSNVTDYQYVSSLALLFNQLMLTVDATLYAERVYGFYEQIVYRIKIFPKSIPLMKIIRSLNAFITRTNWFSNILVNDDNKRSKQLLSILSSFFKSISENIYKYHENYFYEALKMLLSMPLNVLIWDDFHILKNNLKSIITKSLQLGQQIISLAIQAILCLSNLFREVKQESVAYLSTCLPYLEKYINLSKQDSTDQIEQKEEVRNFLFLYERSLTRKQIANTVMKFLGSIGGAAHSVVENSTKDYISWDYYCKLDISVIMGGDTISISLTKLLSRTCWLMLHGNESQKIVSSQFMHAITVYVIGRAAFRLQMQAGQQTKQNFSNFLDVVLPTLLSVSSNPSHPCQQLIHTLVIQSIHFLANTQDPNSPDIQILLKNLISLYTGADDLSYLASKCLSQLVKWHIKQAPQIPNYHYPLIKIVVRNVWSLISNKKARNGLIQFLIKFLKAIHRNTRLMSLYAIEMCSLIVSLGRTDKPIQPLLNYLIKKYILSIGSHIKFLIIEQNSRRFKKLSTLQKLLDWIYSNSLFSIYRQQRQTSYILWESILTKYGHSIKSDMIPDNTGHNIGLFLKEKSNPQLRYLFGENKNSIQISEDNPKLEKNLPKITAYAEIWARFIKKQVFEPSRISTFRDLEEVYLESFCSFVNYLSQTFINLEDRARILTYQTQKVIVQCFLSFIDLYLSLENFKAATFMLNFIIKRVSVFQKQKNQKSATLIQILLKLIFSPDSLIPNFNYDIIYQCSDHVSEISQIEQQDQKIRKYWQQNYYFRVICKFLQSILANNLFPVMQSFLKAQFKIAKFQQIIPQIMSGTALFDRQIKCILTALSEFANLTPSTVTFEPLLYNVLTYSTDNIEHVSKFTQDAPPGEKQISNQKKSMLIWYILQHAQNYEVIRKFLLSAIKKQSFIFQKYEKSIMKSIIANWFAVGTRIVGLAKSNNAFLKLIFVLCKMLPQRQRRDLYELVQSNLIGVGLEPIKSQTELEQQERQNQKKQKAFIISQMLKICFYVFEDTNKFNIQSQNFEVYTYRLICQGLELDYSADMHQQALNLAGLIIRQQKSKEMQENYLSFIKQYRSCLSKLTNFYVPTKISKLTTPDARNKCTSYLKIFKSMVILSNNIKYLQFIFILLKDQELQGFYADMLEDLIHQCISECYKQKDVQEQEADFKWMVKFYETPGFDQDPWANIRVIFVDKILIKAIKVTKQEVLIRFFQQESVNLLNSYIKSPITPFLSSIKELILQMELKRAAFVILQELYSNLPRKQKNMEQIHKRELHKQLIKYCIEYLKPKPGQISKQMQQVQITFKQYDRKTTDEEKQKINLKNEKQEKPKYALEYLRKFYCGAYNCLIVTFISTQSNKAHFQSYIFQSKGILWKKIADEKQQDFNFEIQTNFSLMKPVTKINKKLNKRIKEKYWQSSLYAIQEEFVPASLADNNEAALIQQQNAQVANQGKEANQLELDTVNKHPCMINLLRIVDFMHEKFYDGTLPGWMNPLSEQLMSDTCPLSVRILLTKLILNRPQIFSQTIWAQALVKYLVLKQNGGKFIHYFFRDTLRQLLEFIKNGYKPDSVSEMNIILMKVIKALPHPNNYIYNYNIQLMTEMLKINDIWVSKSTVINMLKASQKPKPQNSGVPSANITNKFEWRMCITVVLKCCLDEGVPVLDDGDVFSKNSGLLQKYKFYFSMRKQGLLNLIFEMSIETVKKYRIAAAGFLGNLLKFVTNCNVDKEQSKQLFELVCKFLAKINLEQSNRNSKQRFSLCTLFVCQTFPAILQNGLLYSQVESGLSTYCKQERRQIIQILRDYCKYSLEANSLGFIPHIFMAIRGSITKLLSDTQEVQSSLITLISQCSKNEVLINKDVMQTFYYIYDELERVYAKSSNSKDVVCYYKMLIYLKDFTNDVHLPKTSQIRHLNQKLSKTLLRGLGSQHEDVKKVIMEEFERQSKNYEDTATRMIEILTRLYDPDNESLWLINVVPLIFSFVKDTSDYTRLRFEKPLADVTAFYDWDFRKNFKFYNNSQPFTPAFTLSTAAVRNRRPDGTLEQSIGATQNAEKLRGIIRASQNSYMSQEQQIFTVLASQSDYHPSFESSYNVAQQSSNNSFKQSATDTQQNSKINQILAGVRKKRNKHMDEFARSNIGMHNKPVSVVDNKVRFNKKFDKATDNRVGDQTFVITHGSKQISVRKYKLGELPDIQIATKDLVDPMLFLAGCDYQFAAQLFVIIFNRVCSNSRKQKKEQFKSVICELLRSSTKCEYNFISTLQKSLIYLCHTQKQKIDFSMKDIALRSSTLDYAIVFTQENQIQTLKHPDIQNQSEWKKAIYNNWGDLADLYQQIDEEDLIYGVLMQLVEGEDRKLLLLALNQKKLGNFKTSEVYFNSAMEQISCKRIQQFIAREKIDCNTILGQWQIIEQQMSTKIETNQLSVNQQRIYTIALQNTKNSQKIISLMKNMHGSKNEYQKSVLHILFQKDYDMSYHHLQKSIESFSLEWKKISSFAFNSKHGLIEQVQRKYELEEFLQLYRKDLSEKTKESCEQLFSKWSNRQPNSVYDSSLTFLQILESRMMFSDLLAAKFSLEKRLTCRYSIDWLIQIANGMVEKGILGGAETLIKKALNFKKFQKELFIWDFYDSVAKLKLRQLLMQKTKSFYEYQIVANLVKRQMDSSHSQISELERLKFVSLKNSFFEAYLSSALSSDSINTSDIVNKMQLIYFNYNDLKKSCNRLFTSQALNSKQFQEYKKSMYFKFTLFLEKMLTFFTDKEKYTQVRTAMMSKSLQPERLSYLFVQTLFTSIQISDFTASMSSLQQNLVFSLIMKLIKIIQVYPLHVGEYFVETINSNKIPVWIFLYFIPQMIKFIDNPNLTHYFEDLFKKISILYPEALVYHFNCSYEQRKDRHTEFCSELSVELRQKMRINYLFIEALVLLQYPEVRLRQSLNKFLSIEYQRENVVVQLTELIQHSEYLGKYNRKFIQDYEPKIVRVLNKIKSNDLSVMTDMKTILANIDPSKKDNPNAANLMRDFTKISDGSTFFEQYNFNDWNRIQIPGTSYRKFEEPKPWKKLYIQSFDHSLFTLQSKQRPRRITVYGSDEKKYMLLVKAGEDVRLDQRVEQLFQIMNRILKGNSECSKKQLQIRRFQVTPVKKMMGIFEWVDQSQTLKQFLQTEFKILKGSDNVNFKQRNKAFELRMELLNRLSPNNPAIKDPNHQHKALLGANKFDVVRCFVDCQKHIPYGLLRRALERLSKNYDSFLHIKNSFIANYAVLCCVTYILGIGDRHLENFLIHMSSASIVPIDFGYSFGASFQLGVPQLIPFRLTKAFEQLMEPIGFQGIFKKSMIASFQIFSENESLISDYCEVFVDDPLLEWVWSNKKATSQSKQPEFSSSQDPPQKALFSEKIASVRKKLEGENPRILLNDMLKNSRHKHASYAKALQSALWGQNRPKEKEMSIPDVVHELISIATDKNILGRTYIGWNPYV